MHFPHPPSGSLGACIRKSSQLRAFYKLILALNAMQLKKKLWRALSGIVAGCVRFRIFCLVTLVLL